MIKTKKKNIHLPLVVTGYVLFGLLVIATLISTTIPFGILLFQPNVMHENIAVMVFAFTIGTILPVLLGYLIGDRSIKTKSRLTHHFSGVVFGLFAYWVMVFASVIISVPSDFFADNRNLSIMILNIGPSILVAALATLFAVAHRRSRQAKQDVISYKPFSISLIALILLLPVSSVIQNIVTQTIGIYTFVPVAIVAVVGGLSYGMLRKAKLSRYNKVVWSAISVSVLFVSVFIMPQFLSSISNYVFPTATMELQAAVSGLSFILALLVWVLYWHKQLKTLR